MAATLHIVNTVPGELDVEHVPGTPVHFGIKSTELFAQPGSMRVDLALSSVEERNALPEDADVPANVLIETPEHARPITGEMQRLFSSGASVLTKTQNNTGEASIYEVKVPLPRDSSAIGYVKFKKRTWSRGEHDWCDLSNMVAPFFGLNVGVLDTAARVLLRDNGDGGSLVVGGVQDEPGGSRVAQVELAERWSNLPDGSSIELYLVFNVLGLPPPNVPNDVPLFEVWVKFPDDVAPRVVHQTPAAGLGGVGVNAAETITFLFGNAGFAGDVLEIEDWALLPTYNVAVIDGEPRPGHEAAILPDSHRYSAKKNLLLDKLPVGPWLPLGSPRSSLHFQPGRKDEALYAVIEKTDDGTVAYRKREPAVAPGAFSIEAFMAGRSTRAVGVDTGMGLVVHDGERLVHLAFLATETYRTIGLLVDPLKRDSLDGYVVPVTPVDWTSLKRYRVWGDSLNGSVTVDVDGSTSFWAANDLLPASAVVPDVQVGHVGSAETRGELHLARVEFFPFLSTDFGELQGNPDFYDPVDGGYEGFQLQKTSVNDPGSATFMAQPASLPDVPGLLLETHFTVFSYTSPDGRLFGPNVNTGIGFDIFLGNKVLQVRCFDCGIHGRKIAIIPGGNSDQDILLQTPRGRLFSASVDWTQPHTYRVIYRSFDCIELWIDEMTERPAITIPWRNDTEQFDLPAIVATPEIRFGHLSDLTAGYTDWTFFRWGTSRGYEVAVRRTSQDPALVFSGRVLVRVEFDAG